jgi:probable rRNA maturation factor
VPYRILTSIDDPFASRIDANQLERAAAAALTHEGVEDGAEVSIVITDDATIRDLNRRYAGEDHATDVLSFSLEEGGAFPSGEAGRTLGEVIISLETAERQAREAGHAIGDEVAHLLVHGVLHLLGYDHAEPEEEREMRDRERAVLAQLGSEVHGP